MGSPLILLFIIILIDIETHDISGHGGSIQAALVMDFEADYVTYFNLLIEGLNGQLPNLDVINLVFRIANIEGIPMKFNHQVILSRTSNRSKKCK